jgi:hypothetical protein
MGTDREYAVVLSVYSVTSVVQISVAGFVVVVIFLEGDAFDAKLGVFEI